MEIDDMIAVLQAAKDGKSIQRGQRYGQWKDFRVGVCADWDFYGWNYRVKPEPPKLKEFWICCNGIDQGGFPIDPVIFPWKPFCNRTVIHVREVTDAPSVSSGTEVR